MAYWLVKQEPTAYPYSNLVRDRTTAWTGVHHPTAQRNLRAMRPAERGLYYHTGSERAAVGTFRVVTAPRPDPDDARGAWTVEIAADTALASPVPLAGIREETVFRGSPLVREPRLSVVPLTAPQFRRFLALGNRRP